MPQEKNLPYGEKRLKNYAKWYYERYFPSIGRLREKLMRKSEQNEELVEKILQELEAIFIEELLIDQHVRALIDAHKSEQIIRQTLTRKKFEIQLINIKIEEYHEDLLSWENHQMSVEKKWKELTQKGKSKKNIFQTLSKQFPHFRDNIHSLCENNQESEEENLGHTYEKLTKGKIPQNATEKQKIAAKLMQRGFDYNQIKRLLFEK